MCGIFAYTGDKNAVPKVLEGLEKLEYRGYDSAGLAVIDRKNRLKVIKTVGYVSQLSEEVFNRSQTFYGRIAIGHTRWATHGKVNKINAHPQLDCSKRIAVVHNGVVENFEELKRDLKNKGHHFVSQTDTEVISHLIEEFLKHGSSFKTAFQRSLSSLVGAWAVAVLSSLTPETLWLGRLSSPLAIGLTKEEVYISSDSQAFPYSVKRVVFLEDGQLARISLKNKKRVEIFNLEGKPVNYRLINKGLMEKVSLAKGKFPHFMLKEISEQSLTVERGLKGRVDYFNNQVVLGGLRSVEEKLKEKEFIGLMACGTSLNAALVGKMFGIGALGLSVWSENSSDYSQLSLDKRVLDRSAVFYISQSGETADTLSSLKLIQKKTRALNLGIVNVVGSSLARRVEAGIYTRAGVEVGVAATKSFTNQLLALLLGLIYIGQLQGKQLVDQDKFFKELQLLPAVISKVLQDKERIKKTAGKLVEVRNFMFLGRHLAYPLALEGALKLKEISYRFSYGDYLGSLKHGPLAVISPENVVVVIVFSQEPELKKSISNIHEIVARQGRVVVISDLPVREFPSSIEHFLPLPHLDSLWLMPLVTAPILQLLAYYLAVFLGREIDKPRYLAKSVTVI